MTLKGSIRREVQNAYKRLHNWRAVGAEFEITSGMAYRIAVDGYEPKDPKIRIKLGLAAMAMAPVCQACGEVHVSSRCTKKPMRRRRSLIDFSGDELRWMLEEREEL